MPSLPVMVAVTLSAGCYSPTPNGVVMVSAPPSIPLSVRVVVPGIMTPWPTNVLTCSDWLLSICPEIGPSVALSFSIPLTVPIYTNWVASSLFCSGLVGFWFFSCAISSVGRLLCGSTTLLPVNELFPVMALTPVMFRSFIFTIIDTCASSTGLVSAF